MLDLKRLFYVLQMLETCTGGRLLGTLIEWCILWRVIERCIGLDGWCAHRWILYERALCRMLLHRPPLPTPLMFVIGNLKIAFLHAFVWLQGRCNVVPYENNQREQICTNAQPYEDSRAWSLSEIRSDLEREVTDGDDSSRSEDVDKLLRLLDGSAASSFCATLRYVTIVICVWILLCFFGTRSCYTEKTREEGWRSSGVE